MPEYFMQNDHAHLLCGKGFAEFKFNGKKMRCGAGDFLFWFAGSRVSEVRLSKNFKAKILLVEKDYLNNNLTDQNWSIAATLYSRENPVKKLDSDDGRKRILENFAVLYARFLEIEHHFYSGILRLQMQVFVPEMWNLFAKAYENRQISVQNGTLYERFIQLVESHCTTEREVQYYADSLNITPKYLNLVCKKASGATASEWIRRYAREHLRFLLENRSLNLAEIADQMHFSSASFFTRYTKKLLGMTPSSFRKRMG